MNAINLGQPNNLERLNQEIIVIDSNDRNRKLYESYNYSIDFGRTFQNVVRAEIIAIRVPRSSYNVTLNNNKFHFQETSTQVINGTWVEAVVAPGYYTITDLVNTLITAMNNASAGNTYSAVVDTIKRRITITTDDAIGSGIFNIIMTNSTRITDNAGYMTDPNTGVTTRLGTEDPIWLPGSIGKMLGFSAVNLTGYSSAGYTTQNSYQLNPTDYIACHIQFGTWILENIVSKNRYIDKATCLIMMDTTGTEYYQVDRTIENKYIFHFPQAISFQRINVSFRDPYGNYYDFNGLENQIVVKLITLSGREIIHDRRQIMY